jgi:hypothetical protein
VLKVAIQVAAEADKLVVEADKPETDKPVAEDDGLGQKPSNNYLV